MSKISEVPILKEPVPDTNVKKKYYRRKTKNSETDDVKIDPDTNGVNKGSRKGPRTRKKVKAGRKMATMEKKKKLLCLKSFSELSEMRQRQGKETKCKIKTASGAWSTEKTAIPRKSLQSPSHEVVKNKLSNRLKLKQEQNQNETEAGNSKPKSVRAGKLKPARNVNQKSVQEVPASETVVSRSGERGFDGCNTSAVGLDNSETPGGAVQIVKTEPGESCGNGHTANQSENSQVNTTSASSSIASNIPLPNLFGGVLPTVMPNQTAQGLVPLYMPVTVNMGNTPQTAFVPIFPDKDGKYKLPDGREVPLHLPPVLSFTPSMLQGASTPAASGATDTSNNAKH